MNQPTEATPAPPRHRGPRHLLRARRCSYPAQIPAQKKKARAIRTRREGGRAMLLPRRCHKRSTMPDAEAARRHEGRVSGESRGEGEFTHECGGAAGVGLLGACARGVRRWEGGGVGLGQGGNAAARKRPAGFWVFSVACSWGACLGSLNEFVFVCSCFIAFLSGEGHGPTATGSSSVTSSTVSCCLLVFRFHCWMDSLHASMYFQVPNHAYVEKSLT